MSEKIEIVGTDPRETDQSSNGRSRFTDISLTNLVAIKVSIINSERQAIWARYQAMLVANSIVIGFIGSRTPEPNQLLGGVVFGLFLSAAWLITTINGWKLFMAHHESTLRFEWKGLDHTLHPSHPGEQHVGSDWIRPTAVFVICLFALGYGLLAWLHRDAIAGVF